MNNILSLIHTFLILPLIVLVIFVLVAEYLRKFVSEMLLEPHTVMRRGFLSRLFDNIVLVGFLSVVGYVSLSVSLDISKIVIAREDILYSIVTIGITNSLRLVSLASSRERALEIAYVYIIPFSIIISAILGMPQYLVKWVYIGLNLSTLLMILLASVTCYLIVEAALTNLYPKLEVRRELHEMITCIPFKPILISGRAELYNYAADLIDRATREVVGLSGTFACIGEEEGSISHAVERFREALANAIKRGVKIRYVGPITARNADNVKCRLKLGVKIRHVQIGESFCRFIVVDNRHTAISLPLTGRPECHVMYYLNNPIIAIIFEKIFENLWRIGEPAESRLKSLKELSKPKTRIQH